MKVIILLISFLSITLICSSQKQLFIRVYDESGHKITSGKSYSFTDSSMLFNEPDGQFEYSYRLIESIKTKRTIGHSVLVGAATTGTALAILGAISACPGCIEGFTVAEGVAGGFAIGAVAGGTAGAIIAETHKRETILIHKNYESFQKAKQVLSQPINK